MILDVLFGFFLGNMTACVFLMVYVAWKGNKISKSRKETLKKLQDEVDALVKSLNNVQEPVSRNGITTSSVNDRLKKVRDLTEDQLAMQSQVETPQKNGLDGRSKNSLSREIKRMEEEKKEILYSILKDGFDPEVSVMTDAGIEMMPLSELMLQMGLELPPSEGDKSKSAAQKVKLTVHQGGKQDTPNLPN
jgi:hypothetical protein